MSAADTGSSTQKRIYFAYSIGDLCLFRLSFNASLRSFPFHPERPDAPPPSVSGEFPDRVDVIGYLGIPISEPRPGLEAGRNGIRYNRNQTINYYLDLRSSFDDYIQQFSSKTRNTLQRKVRKIISIAEGTLECRRFCTPETVIEFHALARQVAAKTYQERLFGGAIPASPEFVEKVHVLAESDCFRGYILSIHGKPVSYLYLPIEDGVVTYGYLGYDPEYAQWSPGTVLLYFALEQLFGEGKFRYFNFTYGEGESKKLFGRGCFLRADVYIFRWSVRNTLAVYGHLMTVWSTDAIGRGLSVLGIRQMLRKLLRRQ